MTSLIVTFTGMKNVCPLALRLGFGMLEMSII